MLPTQVIMIPQYLIYYRLGLVPGYVPLILPYFCGQAFFIYQMMQFMQGIPKDLDEAATIDGCSKYQIYSRIILPLMKPSIVTTVIIQFYWKWDDYMGPLLYLSRPQSYTVSIAIKLFADSASTTDYGAMFAMSTLSLIPVFLIFLFFNRYLVQGIGTSGSQSIIGNWATDISSWHTVAWGLLAIGAVAMVLFVLFPMPEVQEHKTEGKVSPKEIMSCPAFLSLVLIIGLYFIAEHGIMNWLVSYATNALEVPMGQAANFTAVFFGCVMVGRLVLSSLVDKLGIYRCLRLFATSAAVLYTAGVLLGAPGLWLLAVSGLLFSILYPTLVMLIPRYWPSHAASSASGLVLSVASLADILFNAVFGSLVDAIGYRTSFLIMPACMVGCTALLWLFFAKAKKLERCD
mgnify:CR=1 FL=1